MFNLRDVSKIIKLRESERRMALGGVGNGESLTQGHKVSIMKDEI